MAGFRNREGDGGGGYPPRHGQQGFSGPQGSPGGQGPYGASGAYGGGSQGAGAYGGGPQGPYGAGPQGAGHPGGHPPTGEPEYIGAPTPAPPYHDSPGHTRAFTMGDASLVDPQAGQDAYPFGGDNVATYRAGQASAPPAGPRLHWKQLLTGLIRNPGRTFWQMRDHAVWGPALTVTFLYGLLAVFGFDAARSDVLNATLATSIPWVLTTGVAVVLCGLTLGAVTNTLARQLGGDGAWAPTVGLAMLITSLTDAPRLFFALFLSGGNGFVQLLGWLTWIACAALLTSMVGKSHDLPWFKALGASSIQLVALLMLFKLPLI
ncbi:MULTISPECIES: Yip1 family protein [unclassified Streptomyces]|uniref:Yip1 family protein n=1 Tax=unclassified Streptomyces TaxID=2593676 RepID=UPI002E2BCA82|nr:Yip1 family protein [Streptomyces sp. NBC_00223]